MYSLIELDRSRKEVLVEPTGEAEALPILRSWLFGRHDHPLQYFFGPPPHLDIPPGVTYTWWRDPILTTIEDMLTTLERARPQGLDHTRRKFRDLRGLDLDARNKFYELRPELVVAAWLAKSGIPFCFNTGAGPDLLLIAQSGHEVGIEISTRAPRGLNTLATDIYLALQAVCVDVEVHLFALDYPPVSIRTTDYQRIFDRVIQAARHRSRSDDGLIETAIRPDTAASRNICRIQIQLSAQARGAGPSVMTSGMARPDSPHLYDIANEVAKKPLRDMAKQRQARSRPTLLITDVSRCGGASNYSLTTWIRIFDGLWEPNDPFVAITGITCYPNHCTFTAASSANPHATPAALREVVGTLGPAALVIGLDA